jgi:hypothetical protein
MSGKRFEISITTKVLPLPHLGAAPQKVSTKQLSDTTTSLLHACGLPS